MIGSGGTMHLCSNSTSALGVNNKELSNRAATFANPDNAESSDQRKHTVVLLEVKKIITFLATLKESRHLARILTTIFQGLLGESWNKQTFAMHFCGKWRYYGFHLQQFFDTKQAFTQPLKTSKDKNNWEKNSNLDIYKEIENQFSKEMKELGYLK